MKREITIGFILAFCGAAIGYVVKTIEERPQPALLIESVALKKIPKENVPNIDVPKALQALSRESHWMDNLPDQISFKDLEPLIKKHKETVEQLEKLSIFVPKLLQFVTSHVHETAYKTEYHKFLAANTDALALTYLTMNFQGIIRRGEIKLQEAELAYPGTVGDENILAKAIKKGWKLPSDEEPDKATVLALSLLVEWFPNDLKSIVEVMQGQLSSALVPNQNLLIGLTKIFEEAKKMTESESILAEALLVNNGRVTVTFDRYAVLSVSGLNKSFLMLSDKDKDRISVSPGEAKAISLRLVDSLTTDEFEQLETLYETKILRCSLTTRMVSTAHAGSEWVTSLPTEFSGDITALKQEFLKNAKLPTSN